MSACMDSSQLPTDLLGSVDSALLVLADSCLNCSYVLKSSVVTGGLLG